MDEGIPSYSPSDNGNGGGGGQGGGVGGEGGSQVGLLNLEHFQHCILCLQPEQPTRSTTDINNGNDKGQEGYLQETPSPLELEQFISVTNHLILKSKYAKYKPSAKKVNVSKDTVESWLPLFSNLLPMCGDCSGKFVELFHLIDNYDNDNDDRSQKLIEMKTGQIQQIVLESQINVWATWKPCYDRIKERMGNEYAKSVMKFVDYFHSNIQKSIGEVEGEQEQYYQDQDLRLRQTVAGYYCHSDDNNNDDDDESDEEDEAETSINLTEPEPGNLSEEDNQALIGTSSGTRASSDLAQSSDSADDDES